jgi:hypothetical protein
VQGEGWRVEGGGQDLVHTDEGRECLLTDHPETLHSSAALQHVLEREVGEEALDGLVALTLGVVQFCDLDRRHLSDRLAAVGEQRKPFVHRAFRRLEGLLPLRDVARCHGKLGTGTASRAELGCSAARREGAALQCKAAELRRRRGKGVGASQAGERQG